MTIDKQAIGRDETGTVDETTVSTTIDRDKQGRVDHISQVRKVVRFHHVAQNVMNLVTLGSAVLYVYDFTVISHHLI